MVSGTSSNLFVSGVDGDEPQRVDIHAIQNVRLGATLEPAETRIASTIRNRLSETFGADLCNRIVGRYGVWRKAERIFIGSSEQALRGGGSQYILLIKKRRRVRSTRSRTMSRSSTGIICKDAGMSSGWCEESREVPETLGGIQIPHSTSSNRKKPATIAWKKLRLGRTYQPVTM